MNNGSKVMKVLHVWNIAGVASVLAKFMDRLYGTESTVLNRKANEVYGLTTYGILLDYSPRRFALTCILRARNVDIVHIHDLDTLLRWRWTFSKPSVIIHYHGTRVRGKWLERKQHWKYADKILYSTTDMKNEGTPENAVYLPCCPDTDLFHPSPECPKKPNSALSMAKDLDIARAKEYATRYGLELTIQPLGVPHVEMPKLLNKYEYYIDTKTSCHCLSKTALEALSCGLKVINCHGDIIEKLPIEHRTENVCKKLYQIYRKLNQKR